MARALSALAAIASAVPGKRVLSVMHASGFIVGKRCGTGIPGPDDLIDQRDVDRVAVGR